ncbi:MAG: sugar nucleotide-binding protein [Hyphomicrobiales bacterium]|uniref:SDR family oxidoreductase n=1 Tax=Roseibium sp. TaxID=1936156 RepID=UPI003298E38E
MSKLLLLGATGLAGQAFCEATKQRGFTICTVARRSADVLCDITEPNALEELLTKEAPDVLVNAAGMVNLAACEVDPGLAWLINARPAGILAKWSQKTGRPFIQISTDHFFSGDVNRAHNEEAAVTLINEYARGKYAGEALALTAPQALVLRTSIVGIRGWDEPSFAEWAIAAVNENRDMTLFADTWTSSIDTSTFAHAALELMFDKNVRGLLNLAAGEVYSKEAFIREISKQMGKQLTRAQSGSIHVNLPGRAESLGLDVTRAETRLGRKLPGIREVVASILQE